MCFSFRVSLGTFIFSWSSCIYLLNKGLSEKKKQDIIFLMIFSSMQLSDAILWYTGMKKNTVNYVTTSLIIPLILSLQVIFNLYTNYKNEKNKIKKNGNKNKRNENNKKYLTGIATLVVGYLFYRFNGYSRPVCSNKLSSPVWASKEIQFWELIIFATLVIYPKLTTWVYTVFIAFPLIFIFFGGGYGSLWCAIANVLTFYYLYKY
jgi:hypothetical protein